MTRLVILVLISLAGLSAMSAPALGAPVSATERASYAYDAPRTATTPASNARTGSMRSKRTAVDLRRSPYTTRAATNKATGGPATAYYRQSGAHVFIDDATGEVIQLSNRRNPTGWIPDSSIIDPYRRGG